jgi:hypothetical protein
LKIGAAACGCAGHCARDGRGGLDNAGFGAAGWGSVRGCGGVAGVREAHGRACDQGVRAVGTTINPVAIDTASILVTSGVYRISRNPMYVGLTSVLAALGVGLGSGWALVGPVVFVLFITRFQIVPEERVMLAKFGAEYGAYRDTVRRWL